jgi:hypothetical protein
MSAKVTEFLRYERTQLGEHYRQCVCARSPLHRMQCAAEGLHAFVAPRFVTTLVVLALLAVLVLASL